jgi:carnitine O-palmitoyltransferase 1
MIKIHFLGWMFEGRGRISLITRVWAITLRALSAGHQGFYSFYKFCPSLPVPTLEETIEKYLISMKPLLTEKEFAELKVITRYNGTLKELGVLPRVF